MYARIVYRFFSWYISRIIKKDFSRFSYNTPEFENQAILLLSNHFSWWDGFLMFQLNKLYFKKAFHVMVSEENYNKVRFLKHLGAFPVKQGGRQMLESLEYAGKLLDDKNNLVLVFPQGRLHSNHVDSIAFEKGLINLINSSKKDFQYVFSAIFVDYFQKRKPSVRCYLQTWQGEEFVSLQLIKSAYNKHYETSRQQQCRHIV